MAFKDNGRSKPDRDARKRAAEPRWAAAEREVCRLLSKLIPEWCLVLNDVPFPYGNLDHLVIRPDLTTFLVETKSHHGTVTWNGKQLLINKRPFSSNPIGQINRSIRWMRHMIGRLFGRKPWIVSILVFPNATVAIKHSVRRINIMGAEDLLPFIRNFPDNRKG